MSIQTYDPFTGELLGNYKTESEKDALEKIKEVYKGQESWGLSLDERIEYFKNTIKRNFEKETENLAKLMTREMGKPISQSIAEVKKSIRLIDYLIDKAHEIFDPEYINTEAKKSYVRFDPLGVIMSIEPWNFPVWQVARAAFPALMAGNGVVLKHASIVTGTSLKIQELIDLPVFKSLIVDGKTASSLIKYVDGVAFTGSTPTGAKIAEEAGRNLKKIVMELGGSDPFIVLKSADLEKAAKNAVLGRLQNNGQSCIASKRILVHEEVFDEFSKKFEEEMSKVTIGNPLDEKTYLGPLSSKEQVETIRKQISELKPVSNVIKLGEEKGNIIPPTIVITDMNYQEEIFGPVAILKKFRNNEMAIKMANETPFGLGTSIWGDEEEAEKMVPFIQAGMVFVNSIVFSDPRIPFGGVKKSGIGRELSKYGSREFTNMKTVWIA
jgi:succinate-semialdehyde dehydrogenase/glutarate-semialdehyde dehydrogenase